MIKTKKDRAPRTLPQPGVVMDNDTWGHMNLKNRTQPKITETKTRAVWTKEDNYHLCYPQDDWMLLVYQEAGSLIWKYEVVHSDGHDFKIMANGNMPSKRFQDAKDMAEKEFDIARRKSLLAVLGFFGSMLFLGLAMEQMVKLGKKAENAK